MKCLCRCFCYHSSFRSSQTKVRKNCRNFVHIILHQFPTHFCFNSLFTFFSVSAASTHESRELSAIVNINRDTTDSGCNLLISLDSSVFLCASPQRDEFMFVDSGIDLVDENSLETIEEMRRKQIYDEIQRVINSHNSNWISYQSTSIDATMIIDSVERI